MAIRTKTVPGPSYDAPVVGTDRRASRTWFSWADAVSRALTGALLIDSELDPPSIPAVGSAGVTVTAAGVAVGDFAIASFSALTADVSLTAAVTAADTVVVRFINHSAAPVDLATGTLRVKVEKS
jgi:hypothetical protein